MATLYKQGHEIENRIMYANKGYYLPVAFTLSLRSNRKILYKKITRGSTWKVLATRFLRNLNTVTQNEFESLLENKR